MFQRQMKLWESTTHKPSSTDMYSAKTSIRLMSAPLCILSTHARLITSGPWIGDETLMNFRELRPRRVVGSPDLGRISYVDIREFGKGQVRRISLPRTPVPSLLFALLLHNRYYWQLGDGSRPPLLG